MMASPDAQRAGPDAEWHLLCPGGKIIKLVIEARAGFCYTCGTAFPQTNPKPTQTPLQHYGYIKIQDPFYRGPTPGQHQG